MSPAARLLLLLLVVVALPFLPAPAIAIATAAAAVVVISSPKLVRARVLTALVRILWLLFAVAAVIVIFSPGPFGVARFVEAAWRCGVLVCAVTAVQLSLSGISTEALAAALARLLAPLRWTRLPVDVFARRLTLTLDAVPRVQALIAATPAPASGGFVERVAGRAAAVIRALE